MRLKQSERVRYGSNPLVEVVAQVRFPRVLEIDDHLPLDFHKEIQAHYPLFEIQEAMLSVHKGQASGSIKMDDIPRQQTYHFISADNVWRVSLNSEFIALTCTQYERWEDFIPKMMHVLKLVENIYQVGHITRIGLRYRDLIVREQIGLNKTHWSELIAPFLIGPIMPGNLLDCAAIPEADIIGTQSFIGFRLEDCLLNLVHGLVNNERSDEQAYLIDADFFHEEVTRYEHSTIQHQFERFHSNAGSIFRSCIQDCLHNALDPMPVI